MTLVKLSQLGCGYNAEQMSRGGISRVDKADFDGLNLFRRQVQIRECQAFTRAQAHMHLVQLLTGLNLKRTARCGERSFA